MHDIAQLESSGIATVVLCTTAFTKAADEQWEALGFAEHPVVAVGHPLGSMPLEQVLAEAEKAVEPVLERLTGARAAARLASPVRPAAGAPGDEIRARRCQHDPEDEGP